MAKRKRGSSSPLSMTAVAPRKQDPYKYTRDGKKQKVKGQANVPTARQKQKAIELASSVVGGPIAGKLLGKAAGKLAGRAAAAGSKAASKVGKRMTGANRRRANRARKRAADKPDVINAPPPKPQAQLPKPKPIRGTDQTSGPTIRAGQGDPSKGAIPAVRKPTTPAATPKPKVPAKRTPTTPAKTTGQKRGFDLGSTKPKSKNNILGPLAGGTAAAGTAAYLLQSEKDAKPAKSSQAPVNKEPTVNKMSDYELADDTNIRSPRKAASKPAPEQDDEFYKFYGKEGTGLGDFSRKFGIKYATQKGFERDFPDHGGEQMGGRPGKSKMKTQGLNRSKRSGFSGRGAGAALRGF